jgi:hypothetical protein
VVFCDVLFFTAHLLIFSSGKISSFPYFLGYSFLISNCIGLLWVSSAALIKWSWNLLLLAYHEMFSLIFQLWRISMLKRVFYVGNYFLSSTEIYHFISSLLLMFLLMNLLYSDEFALIGVLALLLQLQCVFLNLYTECFN